MPGALSAEALELDHAAYAAARAGTFARLVPLRRERRLRVGDLLVAEFESAETLQIQVQEMVFTERLTDPAEIAHEIDAYSRMLPTSHELCATLFLELTGARAVRTALAEVAGIQHALSLQIGTGGAADDPRGGGVRVPGVELRGLDEEPDAPTETVTVHVVRFRLTDAQRDAFRDPAVPVQLAVDHPAYAETTPISGDTRRALITDLALR